MRRREFIAILGGAAAAWPVAARAQQPAVPVIGFLDSRSPDALTDRLRGFRQGLKDTGYVEGENVSIVYRWAENQFDRVPVMEWRSRIHQRTARRSRRTSSPKIPAWPGRASALAPSLKSSPAGRAEP
jgi:ABC-type uncharacterized transport system substrate-binding protein